MGFGFYYRVTAEYQGAGDENEHRSAVAAGALGVAHVVGRVVQNVRLVKVTITPIDRDAYLAGKARHELAREESARERDLEARDALRAGDV